MDDEAAFLAAMRAAPESRLTRHVYADWLEERGDPRHELVRVCEAMRGVPVWSDDYWQLKARRNELWTRFPIEWLEATGYDGSDYDPIFRDDVPDGVRERWRLIREFTERWHGVSVPDVGGRSDVVAREEARLGLTLPESVRELIAFAHDVGVFGADDQYTPSRCFENTLRCDVELMHEEPALRLFGTGQDDDCYSVAMGDLGLADPPMRYYDMHHVRRDEHGSPTATNWVFGELFNHLVMDRCMRGIPADPDVYLSRLSASFPAKGKFDDYLLHEASEIIVRNFETQPVEGEPVKTRVVVLNRRPVSWESLPTCLFEGDVFVVHEYGWQPDGLSHRHWEELQRQVHRRDWLPVWVSVLRRAEAARTTASGEPRA